MHVIFYVILSVENSGFIAPSGRKKIVRGFWDGGKIWKVRFMPDETGLWHWDSECSDENNDGLHGQAGDLNTPCAKQRTEFNFLFRYVTKFVFCKNICRFYI